MPICDGEIGYLVSRYVEIYIVAISIIVVAVPEGLPLAVMISLAYSIQKMLLDQNFVKSFSHVKLWVELTTSAQIKLVL